MNTEKKVHNYYTLLELASTALGLANKKEEDLKKIEEKQYKDNKKLHTIFMKELDTAQQHHDKLKVVDDFYSTLQKREEDYIKKREEIQKKYKRVKNKIHRRYEKERKQLQAELYDHSRKARDSNAFDTTQKERGIACTRH